MPRRRPHRGPRRPRPSRGRRGLGRSYASLLGSRAARRTTRHGPSRTIASASEPGHGAGSESMGASSRASRHAPSARRPSSRATPAIVPRMTAPTLTAAEPGPVDTPTTEAVRVAFADVWADMGPAWNVTPSVARVHGYLLAHGGVLTEREVREALGLSHRATSLALVELEEWRLVERTEDPRRAAR